MLGSYACTLVAMFQHMDPLSVWLPGSENHPSRLPGRIGVYCCVDLLSDHRFGAILKNPSFGDRGP